MSTPEESMTGSKLFVLAINQSGYSAGLQSVQSGENSPSAGGCAGQVSPCSGSPSTESSVESSIHYPHLQNNNNSKYLSVGYCIVTLGASGCEEDKVEEFEAVNLKADLENLGHLASTCQAVVTSNEDMRQVLHPTAAGVRDEYWQLHPCFYSFINVDPLLLTLYSSEKTACHGDNTENNSENDAEMCSSTAAPGAAPSTTPGAPGSPSSNSVQDRVRLMAAAVRNFSQDLESHVEQIQEGYQAGVCVDNFVDNGLVVRTRGLPWQASDQDVALFFAGLNIAPGGVALCLSPDGRRNGEAIVRFETRVHREMALARHRQFLHSRYIEVYRATGDDFLKVAVGSDIQAVQFASRQAAMIIRMRGLPFDCTETQIEQFFNGDGEPSGIIEQGIMFVARPDGRPSGDAFVLFADDVSGKRALLKHKNRIGTRYIELFRTTQAEVQQVFNRTRASPQATITHMMPTVMTHPKRDCVRLRGLPYEAAVKDVADFLGPHSRRIAFQGVHMIYNNQGHPSGECFIQMDSEASAASAAASMHNKYMEIGKKKRYIEVFQCSAEEIANILNASPGQGSPNGSSSSSTTTPQAQGLFPNPMLQTLPLQGYRPAPQQLGLIPNPMNSFFPQTALSPEQLLFAQFNHIPVYTQEQLQMAAHQLDANNLIQQQLAAAQFQQQLTAAVQNQQNGVVQSAPDFVPMTSTLIHT